MDVTVIGTGITRFGMFVETRLRELASEAADRALADAGVSAEEVGLVVFGNAAAGLLTGRVEFVDKSVRVARRWARYCSAGS